MKTPDATTLHPSPDFLLPASPRLWPAQVITRWAGGCHIRIADAHDTILPPDALPDDADEFRVRIEPDGLVVFTAA